DRLRAGDRLPVVRDVVATSGVNANTVLKAYRELEHAGLVEIRQGSGTFVTDAMAAIDSEILNERRASMSTWVAQARAAGITDDMATLLRNALTAEGTRRRHVTGWSGSTYRSNATAAGSPVANAVALGSRPDVLLLDEPLANLDPLVRREVMADLLTEVADTGMSVVLSTHVVAEPGGVTDHLLLLSHGRLALAGDTGELLNQHVQDVGPPAEQPPGPGTVVEQRHRERHSTDACSKQPRWFRWGMRCSVTPSGSCSARSVAAQCCPWD